MEKIGKCVLFIIGSVFVILGALVPIVLQYLVYNGPKWMLNTDGTIGIGTVVTGIALLTLCIISGISLIITVLDSK